jgi:diguanylate cyclase (GGDEF)-like protein/PAS domain S-box-containing protein
VLGRLQPGARNADHQSRMLTAKAVESAIETVDGRRSSILSGFPLRSLGAVLVFTIALFAWLLPEQTGERHDLALDGLAQIVGPLAVLALIGGDYLRARRQRRDRHRAQATSGGIRAHLVPTALILAVLCHVTASLIRFPEQLGSQETIIASWADVVWLGAYPCFLIALLAMPRQPLSAALRIRVALEGSVAVVAAATFSWYFLLGPLLLQGEGTPLEKAINGAYPLGDLLLLACMVLLPWRATDAARRRATTLLAGALIAFVAADALYLREILNGGDGTGGPLDAVLLLAFMLVGLVARETLLATAKQATEPRAVNPIANESGGAGWRGLLPFALIPAVTGLAVWSWQEGGDLALASGVGLGAAALVGLVLLRQAFALVENGRLYRTVRQELTERTRAELALATSEERYRLAVRATQDVIYDWDLVQDIVGWSPNSLRLFGSTPETMGYRGADWVGRIHPEDAPTVAATLHAAFAAGESFVAEYRFGRADGSYATVLDRGLIVRAPDGSPARLVGAMADVTERKHAETALAHQALHDALTGLPNRTLLHDRLRQATLAATREAQPFALLLLDLDRFKEVNDSLGHHAGDTLLKQVANRLRQALRPADTVARLGGDEFAILLPRMDVVSASLAAARIIEALEAPVSLDEHDVVIGASIGIALHPEHGEDADMLLRRADMAMYRAKQNRGGYAVYAPEQEQFGAGNRLALSAALRRAIADDQLSLHYQPKVDCVSGALAGVEALVRWEHPELGTLAPDQFIPLAERTGLIKPLSRWVLDRALRQCSEWQQQGLRVPIAVNLSAHDVQDAELPAMVAELLARWSVPSTWLKLEITESALVGDPWQALQILTELCASGVRIAIDDFGTGYSSLAYLKQLPIHEIKIDQSFVSDMISDRKDLAIVRSTIELGHNLGLETVAEGVEDQGTLELLGSLGCDVAQGFHVSRPLLPADLADWCRASGFVEGSWRASAA